MLFAQVGDGSSWIVQPLALTKLALLLMEIEKEHKNRDSKPMVIGVDDETSGTACLSSISSSEGCGRC